MPHARTWVSYLIFGLVVGLPGVMDGTGDGGAVAQTEQVVEVTIKEYKFVTKQGPLRLGLPTVIKVRNSWSAQVFLSTPSKIPKRYRRRLLGYHSHPLVQY